MGAVSETIVREFFELHGFFVRQQRKYIAPTRREDEEIDFVAGLLGEAGDFAVATAVGAVLSFGC